MPRCLFGSEPTPQARGLQEWVTNNDLTGELLNLIQRVAPNLYHGLGIELFDYDTLCASNPDPPEPITPEDIELQFLHMRTGGQLGSPEVYAKIWQALRYQKALVNCVCLPAPPPTGLACPYTNFSTTLPSTGVTPAVPYAIPPDVYSGWILQGGPPPTVYFPVYSLGFTNHTPATTQRFIEWSSDQIAWHPIAELPTSATATAVCHIASPGIAAPIAPANGWVRIHNNSVSSLTLAGFSFCFCAVAPTAKPLPSQPQLPSVPTQPAVTCSTDDLCLMVHDLIRSVMTIATQLSDVQAILTGVDQLAVLSQQQIEGEGELSLAVGTRAVSLEVTKLSDNAFTSALGRPRGLMRVGSVRFFDGTGYTPRQFIDGDRFDVTRPPGALAISWQLLPSAVAQLKFLR